MISIHAPREGGDVKRYTMSRRGLEFQSTPPARGATYAGGGAHRGIFISIHAPREGGDAPSKIWIKLRQLFQSTPPARGATAKMHSFTCGSLTNK